MSDSKRLQEINFKRNHERKPFDHSSNEISTIQGVYEVFLNPRISSKHIQPLASKLPKCSLILFDKITHKRVRKGLNTDLGHVAENYKKIHAHGTKCLVHEAEHDHNHKSMCLAHGDKHLAREAIPKSSIIIFSSS